MRDPYLYEDVPVLRNLLGIKTQELLDEAEDMCGQHQLRIMHILQMEVISERKSIYTRLYMMLLKNN